ncbi:MAG: glycoside hydrolase family 16 protein, partial [Clostridia bacterium]|nr:glycoside hydrolase family 16 protein [Clostridia bacterium]
PYKEYNTYGVEWNENEYIFYINQKEAGRSSFGGVPQNPEYLLLSLEIAGKDGVSSEDPTGKGRMKYSGDGPTEFKVDYVRCYQYK